MRHLAAAPEPHPIFALFHFSSQMWKFTLLGGLMFHTYQQVRSRAAEPRRASPASRGPLSSRRSFVQGSVAGSRLPVRTVPDAAWRGASPRPGLLSQVSYLVLQRVTPVTHSVGNCVKRVVVIVSSIIFFRNPVRRATTARAAPSPRPSTAAAESVAH